MNIHLDICDIICLSIWFYRFKYNFSLDPQPGQTWPQLHKKRSLWAGLDFFFAVISWLVSSWSADRGNIFWLPSGKTRLDDWNFWNSNRRCECVGCKPLPWSPWAWLSWIWIVDNLLKLVLVSALLVRTEIINISMWEYIQKLYSSQNQSYSGPNRIWFCFRATCIPII